MDAGDRAVNEFGQGGGREYDMGTCIYAKEQVRYTSVYSGAI